MQVKFAKYAPRAKAGRKKASASIEEQAQERTWLEKDAIMDEAMEKVGVLEGAMGGQESDGWNQVERKEGMLDQVLSVDNSEVVDSKADTAYMFIVAHKEVMHDLYGYTPEASEQARKATTRYLQYDIALPKWTHQVLLEPY